MRKRVFYLQTSGAIAPPALESDLVINKEVNATTVSVGDVFQYRIKIDNLGPDDDSNPVVTDDISSILAFASLTSTTSTQGTVSASTSLISWSLGLLPQGNTAALILFFTANSAGTVSNTATVVSNNTDPDLSTNTTTSPTTIISDCIIPDSSSNSWFDIQGTPLTGAGIFGSTAGGASSGWTNSARSGPLVDSTPNIGKFSTTYTNDADVPSYLIIGIANNDPLTSTNGYQDIRHWFYIPNVTSGAVSINMYSTTNAGTPTFLGSASITIPIGDTVILELRYDGSGNIEYVVNGTIEATTADLILPTEQRYIVGCANGVSTIEDRFENITICPSI